MLQPITDIAELSARLGIRHFVLSPGSRCAPLTLAVARHPQLQTRVVPDERAAAFIALGMAQTLGETVGLICTSGTAAYNYAPAVAEAFYQQIPLLVLTADRPPEWIDQQDGQTLRQQQLYGPHVKGSYQLPDTYEHPDLVWHLYRLVNEAISLTQTGPKGPVHINIPLREPFYPSPDAVWQYSQDLKVVERWQAEAQLSDPQWEQLVLEWQQYGRKLIVAGQCEPSTPLLEALEHSSLQQQLPVVADIITNLHGLKGRISQQDYFLMQTGAPGKRTGLQEALQPELLITFGRSVISKNLKLYLRKHPPRAHWHLQAQGPVADTFQSLTRIVPVAPLHFFQELNKRLPQTIEQDSTQKTYYTHWQEQQSLAEGVATAFFEQSPAGESWGEFAALRRCLQSLPEGTQLHLANSMSVRYANFAGLSQDQKGVQVWANRGTSGIDGSSSTAVGCAVVSKGLTVLITGDMAFLYDRNSLWHTFLPANLRILVLNNGGGGIFRMIEGPRRQPELEEFFVTHQPFSARASALDAGMQYAACHSREEFERELPRFLAPNGGAKVLEVFSNSEASTELFGRFKKAILSQGSA
ncbi:2-succinyl-5-enolpyruvyl-6-hydroxy-3-cyclohexene-1-carboxylic-acid synthase [Cesiribacter andamanensis]|uniref:2-succinyl-5-enolpyruvyl-6-hydroxy-3-cyclohexene-1-carboxylate synthase n=1 Tax=Cesiribacter andamanensis AMV16 TaxID=1279009 RepID=M7N6S0_9BACT|nr:2-succinyl-5-enolpyruvyl-6-hydroxy-3-cyclohexene-1-carboxylic-acid synthase [Cesiribacter andamanensis]EMR02931.1 2-succinyl-5-enolpyruvyl-6-hydroxy-3-cyclohexene-1-carboxylate synthase [Cesiribacter andamanensis AMV16]